VPVGCDESMVITDESEGREDCDKFIPFDFMGVSFVVARVFFVEVFATTLLRAPLFVFAIV
jgi:hypothetical protein